MGSNAYHAVFASGIIDDLSNTENCKIVIDVYEKQWRSQGAVAAVAPRTGQRQKLLLYQ